MRSETREVTYIEFYNNIMHAINQDMCMYDEFSKHQYYKKDREEAKIKWQALAEAMNLIKKELKAWETVSWE